MKYIVKNYSDQYFLHVSVILFPTLINKSPDPSGNYFINKMRVGNNITDASHDLIISVRHNITYLSIKYYLDYLI